MRKYFGLALLILGVLSQACTEAAGTNEKRSTKGSFSLNGKEYQVVASSAKTDLHQKTLNIILGGKNAEQQPEIAIQVDNFSGEGVYSFTESVQVSSTNAQDGHHWTSNGCSGKLHINRNKGGQLEATIEGVLTRPDGNTFIPTSIKGTFSSISL